MPRSHPLAVLLRDYGYRVDGRSIIALGIRGFCGERFVRRCRDLFDAAEYLESIIHDAGYSTRLAQLTRPKE